MLHKLLPRSFWQKLIYVALAVGLIITLSRAQFHNDESQFGDFQSLRNPVGATANAGSRCKNPPSKLHITEKPYENYFYSDCHSASQVVLTTPQSDSNLSLISPRLLVAWPAGNSGIVAFFSPKNGKKGSLSFSILKQKNSFPIRPIFAPSESSSSPPVNGIEGIVTFNSSAILTVPILGSIRTIRDYVEGGGILVPKIQNAIRYSSYGKDGAQLNRLWLDKKTVTHLSFAPQGSNAKPVEISHRKSQISFAQGNYIFRASFNYPQLTPFREDSVLNSASQSLIKNDPDRTKSLTFLSYETKLLAGAWRFLTYFGRDTMIALLLLQPILSEGEGGAIETVISAVLERLNHQELRGAVCHEETLGDYATYLREQNGGMTDEPEKPLCTYQMIDTDYYLPVVMRNYFLNTSTGRKRKDAFLKQRATTDFGNKGISYADLALRNAERIVEHAQAFAKDGGQKKGNLRHLEEKQDVGQWRDSFYGIGGGRIPFDVNTALVPAALYAISELSSSGFFTKHKGWSETVRRYAKIWEDKTLDFFTVSHSRAKAQQLVRNYVKESKFMGPSYVDKIKEDVTYHAISLDGYHHQEKVQVMNTDFCFRLFLLNSTNDKQLTPFLNQTAMQVMLPFPVGLSTDVGMFVANPAYGELPYYAERWSRVDYHGTVVWSWPLAMTAKGLEKQLDRCSSSAGKPTFCTDKIVYTNVLKAYNHLWDVIEANQKYLSEEVWSWKYNAKKRRFDYVSYGELSATESDVRQLWSLTFLAIKRNKALSIQ